MAESRQRHLGSLLVLWVRWIITCNAESGECLLNPIVARICCAEAFESPNEASLWRSAGSKFQTLEEFSISCCSKSQKLQDYLLVPDVFTDIYVQERRKTSRQASFMATSLQAEQSTTTFSLPQNSTIVLNIGAHYQLGRDFLERAQEPNTHVLCFEPDQDSFYKLFRWRLEADFIANEQAAGVTLSRLHLLPCAVGPVAPPPYSRIAKLYRSSYLDGQCNSLLPPNPDVKSDFAKKTGCGSADEQSHDAMVVSLREVLSRLPIGSIVDFLKIDAQGLDLEVVRSGGRLVSNMVRQICLEVQDLPDGSPLLNYAGMHTKGKAVALLAQMGFVLETCEPVVQEIKEEDCVFLNTRFRHKS